MSPENHQRYSIPFHIIIVYKSNILRSPYPPKNLIMYSYVLSLVYYCCQTPSVCQLHVKFDIQHGTAAKRQNILI